MFVVATRDHYSAQQANYPTNPCLSVCLKKIIKKINVSARKLNIRAEKYARRARTHAHTAHARRAHTHTHTHTHAHTFSI